MYDVLLGALGEQREEEDEIPLSWTFEYSLMRDTYPKHIPGVLDAAVQPKSKTEFLSNFVTLLLHERTLLKPVEKEKDILKASLDGQSRIYEENDKLRTQLQESLKREEDLKREVALLQQTFQQMEKDRQTVTDRMNASFMEVIRRVSVKSTWDASEIADLTREFLSHWLGWIK